VLKISAAAAVGGILGAARANAAPKSMTIMHESSFIPACDAYFNNTIAPAYEKATGVKIIYETVSVGSIQTRDTTVAETGTGPELAQMAFYWPFLFDEKLVEVTDIAKVIGDKAGGWHVRWTPSKSQAGATWRSAITARSCTATTKRRSGIPNRVTCRTGASMANSHLPGWPAPISRPQSESVAKYVVVDMFAKACAGKSTKVVIADASARLKRIFRSG
jgi:hypothetical protein